MNKSTPEYIRVREEIAKQLYDWNNLTKSYDCVEFGHINSNPEYWRENADSILLIKGIAIVADDQSLPTLDDTLDSFPQSEMRDRMIKVNFKKVVE